MSGVNLPVSYVNLANNIQNDVIFPPLHVGSSSLNDLNTSLWSQSAKNANIQSPNGITINMQVYDNSFPSPGTYYYAIRIDTDTDNLYFGNIRIFTLSFGQ